MADRRRPRRRRCAAGLLPAALFAATLVGGPAVFAGTTTGPLTAQVGPAARSAPAVAGRPARRGMPDGAGALVVAYVGIAGAAGAGLYRFARRRD